MKFIMQLTDFVVKTKSNFTDGRLGKFVLPR